MSNTTLGTKYVVSLTRFVDALRATGLESPLHSPFGISTDFDISTSGIVFLAKASMRHPGGANAYYIPLKSFTELSKPRPQIIHVKGFEGGSSNPVFSPNRDSVAFSKSSTPQTQVNEIESSLSTTSGTSVYTWPSMRCPPGKSRTAGICHLMTWHGARMGMSYTWSRSRIG